MMSRINFLLALLFIAVALSGQQRINKEKLNFDKISGVLKKAKGWEYNETLGEWIDYNNVISQKTYYKEGLYRLLQGRDMMKFYTQNFIKIQTKSVIYKETEYFVLIIDKWNYNIAYGERSPFRETYGYIFSKEEYRKLHNIENLIELKTKYMVSIGTEYQKYNETNFLNMIRTILQTEKSEDSFEYIFPVLKTTEGVIRFYLPENSSSESGYDFDKKYFETSSKNFSKIIIR